MDSYDIVVIGGGIHGVGVAQAAAAAGHSVLLLERTALAAGTSSRSSKLIHGGLRYLEGLHLGLVREGLRERQRLLELAPRLVRRQRFYIPIYPDTSRRPWLVWTGLSCYAVLGGMGEDVRFRSVPKHEWAELDGLRTESLQTVFQYWDAQTDDARLTRAVMQSATSLGAQWLCPAEFLQGVIKNDHCLIRYRYRDNDHSCVAGVVVNAAGPWAKTVLQKFKPTPPPLAVEHVQGTHIELPGRVRQGCYYMEVPSDRRAVFVMPWRDERTLLGTTEHVYTGDPTDVVPLPQEIDYLLEVYRHYFPKRSTQVLDAWTGLRVLPAAQGTVFGRSRETQLPVDDQARPRVLSIVGGKLTGYRATAEKVIHRLQPMLPPVTATADTRTLPLSDDN